MNEADSIRLRDKFPSNDSGPTKVRTVAPLIPQSAFFFPASRRRKLVLTKQGEPESKKGREDAAATTPAKTPWDLETL
jgi:hypothetical protein